MHLNKIIGQLKRHTNPSDAIDKMGRALEKHERMLMEEDGERYKEELCIEMYEAMNGPHFDEEHARMATEDMENEDGSKGPHWTVEETTSTANQYGINFKSEKFNKWDWYVAMNMMWSDYYKVVMAITGTSSVKSFAELAKAWLSDKDIAEGKMWHYFVYIMNDDEDEEGVEEYHNRHRTHRNERYHEDRRYNKEYYNYPMEHESKRERYDHTLEDKDKDSFYDKSYDRMNANERRNTSIRYY